MSNMICIYSKRCWVEGKLQPATVCIENAVITGIHFHKLEMAEDMGDAVIMPGIIDAHIHINEPGRTDWEGFDTATQAAAAGGITTVIDMPLNASPVTTTIKAFTQKLDAAKNKLHVNVGFYGGLIPGNTDELAPLAEAGVLGIKCFLVHSGIAEFPNVGEKELNDAMPIISKCNLPVLAHCEIYENENVSDFDKHVSSYKHYLESRPKKWENDAVKLMISLCRKYNCATHIVHVSSAEALDIIKSAKKDGLPLTAETCAHYIYFNAEEIPDSNCLYKCAPPIRERDNNELLKIALANGTLDFITTDHSPAPPIVKELQSGNLKKAWGGIAGLQFILPASWTALKESMPLEKFIPLLTNQPAAFLKINDRKGEIKVGYDADLVIWNPEQKERIKEKNILFRHKITPYIGKELYGMVYKTIVNGKLVFSDNSIVNREVKNGMIILKNKN